MSRKASRLFELYLRRIYFMKKTYLIASFLVVSAGAIGASAVFNFNGSDTLFTISTDVVNGNTSYPGAPSGIAAIPTLSYIGGGSTTGETAMSVGTQQIAPMSRFLKSGPPCTGTSASPTTSEGLVIALDGVSMIMNSNTGATAACNGVQTDAAKIPALGLAHDTTFTYPAGSYTTYGGATVSYASGSYTFTDWTDILRLLWAGMDHSASNTATKQNCSNPVRAALISQWGQLFETQNCNGSCTKLTGGFRRDDYSGTTDTVTALLNLPGIPSPSHLTDPFCNAPTIGSADAVWHTWPPTGLPKVMQYNGQHAGVLPLAEFQDLDPIRVTCGATDTVCDQDGTRGWVEVVEPTSDINQAQAYPTVGGTTKMGFGGAGILSDKANYYCMNGDTPVFVSSCLEPEDSTGTTFANVATSGSIPLFTFSGPNASTNFDGRAYNLLSHDNTSAGTLLVAANGVGFQASYFRNWGGATGCQLLDATQEIGCIIGSLQTCGLGFAGLGAVQQANADAMRLDGILPVTGNVQAFSYPMSRKLYLDTLKGFANVADTNGELTFAKDEAGKAEIDYYVSNDGFIVLPNSVTLGGSAGVPYCEDFNETMICSATTYPTNSNACATNPSGIPTGGTTCGNATLETYERCDSGTAGTSNAINGGNGSSTSNCSTTCSCKVGGVDPVAGLCCVNAAGVDCCKTGTCTPGQNI